MSTEFISYLHEVFSQFGTIQTRRMFGGFGIYHQGLMFGLVADEILYLKADAISSPAFEHLGLTPFEYDRHGKIIRMSYYQAPEDIFEDFEQATIWAKRAYEAALRTNKPQKSKPQV
ncbi:MAG: TfoX/Sxy family protein [Aquirhabdus sp.]